MISLGIDTSAYTTSMVVMEDKTIIYKNKIMLNVKKGTVGLRQTDAFFQHSSNLDSIFHDLIEHMDLKKLDNIVVSTRPRNIEGSYMPVFKAGERFSVVLSKALNIPLLTVSHQENHLYAALFEHGFIDEFIGVHISGGTTEILDVNLSMNSIRILSKTLDLSFGKLIDRIGVYMGYDFPAGKHMPVEVTSKYPLKKSLKENDFNISGIENKLKELYDKEKDKEKISYSLFSYLSDILIELLDRLDTNKKIIMTGGVSCNQIIKDRLTNYYKDRIFFTSPEFSADHAAGNAYYGNRVNY